MLDFKGQHVCPISLPKSPCHDDQTVLPIMLGWSLISSWAQNPLTIPLEQAEKFVTVVNITTTKAVGKIWCRPPFCLAPMR
jgi:hypothetical protein